MVLPEVGAPAARARLETQRARLDAERGVRLTRVEG